MTDRKLENIIDDNIENRFENAIKMASPNDFVSKFKHKSSQSKSGVLVSKEIEAVFNALLAISDNVFFVGGFVRDLIFFNTISHDIDIATDIKPEEIANALDAIEGGKVLRNAMSFGSVLFLYNGLQFDVTTFREDKEHNGRHANVDFLSCMVGDATRRDFTINALYMDSNGFVYDFFDGIGDMRKKHVKFVGDAKSRIEEDYLRIMRYFRFSASMSDKYDKETLRAIHGCVSGMSALSKERITKELTLTMEKKHCVTAIKQMQNYGVFNQIFGDGLSLNFGKLKLTTKVSHLVINAAKKERDIAKIRKHTNASYFLNAIIKSDGDIFDESRIEIIKKNPSCCIRMKIDIVSLQRKYIHTNAKEISDEEKTTYSIAPLICSCDGSADGVDPFEAVISTLSCSNRVKFALLTQQKTMGGLIRWHYYKNIEMAFKNAPLFIAIAMLAAVLFKLWIFI